MLMRFDPFRELDRVTQMFNLPAAMRSPAMPMDAYREGDRLVVLFDVPGVDPQAIDLTVEKNVLTVRAERSWQPTEGQEVIIAERPQGVFTRQLFLSENLDSEGMQAAYDKGVLCLTIPVAERAKPRRVEVSATGNGGSQMLPTDTTATDMAASDTAAADMAAADMVERAATDTGVTDTGVTDTGATDTAPAEAGATAGPGAGTA
jgi:HSP20 family protein